MQPTAPRLLVNLPPGFFAAPRLAPIFRRLETSFAVSYASANSATEVAPHLGGKDAVLMWSWPRWTAETLAAFPDLRFFAHLDVTQNEARLLLERGLPVSVSRRAFSPAVAEMALTLILSTLRRAPTHQMAMRAGTETWVNRFPDDIDPDERELTGRRVRLVGFGGIGQRLAALLAPFAVDLKVHDPFLPDGVAERFGAANVSLNELVADAEVLVLCAATNAGSKHLLTADHIAALPAKCVFVNVARATLVDNAALLSRLQRGELYAALDVFDGEPLPADSPLRALPNVYLTPHRAGGIESSVARIVSYLADDLEAFFAGRDRAHALTEAMLPMLDS